MIEISEKQLPSIIRTFISASNDHDTNRMLSCFGKDAIVVDDSREFRGKAAIQKWSDDEFIGARVNVRATNIHQRLDQYIVSAEVNGDYPAGPYYFDFYFTVQSGQISKLQITESK